MAEHYGLCILATDVARGMYARDAVWFQKDLDAAIATATKHLRDRLRPLETLRESAGAWCEQLPPEVREALHSIPDIGKTHSHYSALSGDSVVNPESLSPPSPDSDALVAIADARVVEGE